MKTCDLKRFFFALLFSIMPFIAFAQAIIKQTEQKLKSPDGAYEFTFYQKQITPGTKQMYYTLSFKGKEVMKESELGVLIENQLFEAALAVPNDTCHLWCENLALIGTDCSSVDTSWKPVYGEKSIIKDNYNQLTLKFEKYGNGNSTIPTDGYDKRRAYRMDIIVRAYNEGVALCYFFSETNNGLFLHITGEQTQFSFPENTQAYYERWAQGPYSLLPLKDWKDECERPLTLKLENGLTVALAEAQMVDYSRMKFCLNAIKSNTLQASLYDKVDIISPYSTPWRVIMAAEQPGDLIEHNNIILNLNPGNKLENTSWIKPGKVIRVGKLAQADAKLCVDFAAERGLQYIHLDAGWYGPEMIMKSDASKVSETRDLNIPELTAYAASKGIGVFVYVNQRALFQQLDTLLPLYKKWGLKGIKFGFVQVGSNRWTTWMHEAVKKCAEYGLMVDIHDEYRPTGFSRTYPNLMSQEGIRGNEEMPDATHNTILPFTRFLAGAGDYTVCYYNSRVKNTNAHQLALSVVYYSPLQFLYWYAQPSAYTGEPEIEFFDKVKTVWDDTKVINGKIGEFITTARRSGDEWFAGTITNTESRKVTVPLTFLDKGKKYVASIYTDDDAVKTKTHVRVSKYIVNGDSILNFSVKASGGVAMHFVPATAKEIKSLPKLKKNSQL